MNKEDYPKQARDIGYDEMMTYVDNLVKQIAEYNPDQIIGIARSGMPFATFVAQKLDLDLGYYNPKYHHFMPAVEPKRIVFVDENFVSGGTQKDVHEFMATHLPNVEYKLGVVMLDYFCPDKDCMAGTVLDFWANSMACFFKPIAIEERGIRFRDVSDCV